MKIGIAVSEHIIHPCGIARCSIEIIKSLSKIDRYNEYIIFADTKNAQKFLGKGIAVKTLLPRSKQDNLLPEFYHSQFILPLELKKERIDLLHSLFNPLPLNEYCKTIISIHDLIFMKRSPLLAIAPVYARYLTKWLLFSIKQAQKIICPSLYTKLDIVKTIGIPSRKIEVIPLGVSNNFRHIEDEGRIAAFKKRYKLPPKFILHLGDIIPRKNLINSIEAFSRIAKYIEHKLVIVGKRNVTAHHKYYRVLDNRIKNLRLRDRLIFFGSISDDDLVYMYNAAELFLFPSLCEGFGLPILEAMACGTPIVTSNNSSLKEIGSGAGLLVDPHNINDLAQAMTRLLSDDNLKHSLAQKGLQKAKLYSWEITARQTLAIYQEVIGDKKN